MESTLSKNEYTSRINTVIQYISEHLESNLPLEHLAEIACFSPFHFHRIFSSIMNETPADFVLRLRLEKAANLLARERSQSITEIAYNSGFSSPSVFSRAFIKHFGISASKWSKKCKVISKNGKENYGQSFYLNNVDRENIVRKKKVMRVEVKYLPARHVAYVANMHGYKIDKIGQAWEKLCRWASAHDLLNEKAIILGISFDNPDITPEEKCRYYACIEVPLDTAGSKEIGFMNISGGKYAVFQFRGRSDQISEAYRQLYSSWLPASGYQPADQPCYEIYHKSPGQPPRGIIIMDICLPIKPL